jgi:hypothetical protein
MFAKTDIEKYFNAEKGESWVFMVIGIVGIIAAIIFLFFIKTNFYKGAAIPLILVGLLLGVVGFSVYKRSDDDRVRNVYAYDLNPGELKEKELPRMETVMKNFIIYRYTEIVMALIGTGLFFYFKHNIGREFWKGFGAALTIMALLALSADYFAEIRGKIYIDGIKSFVNK